MRFSAVSTLLLALAACGDSDSLQRVSYGGDLTVGEPRSYRFWAHCGIDWIGQFNGAEWKLEAPAPDGALSGVPDRWTPYMDRTDEQIVLQLELLDAAELVVQPVDSPDDLRATYGRTNEPNPGCD